jgi:hypothetical protein
MRVKLREIRGLNLQQPRPLFALTEVRAEAPDNGLVLFWHVREDCRATQLIKLTGNNSAVNLDARGQVQD